MNIQQRVSQLAMKNKIPGTQADAKENSYDDIQISLTEDQQRLISKYYPQLNSIGFKTEEAVYGLCKRYEFNEKILDDHVKVLVTKSKEALEDGDGWATVGGSKHGTSTQNENSKQTAKPFKSRQNEGAVNAGRGGYPKRQNEGDYQEQKYPKKYEEGDREHGGYKSKEKYYQKNYRNEENQQQEENGGGYQRGGYKQRERNYNQYKNKDFESRKDRDLVYYAKKDENKTETTEQTETRTEEVKPEPVKAEQPKQVERVREEPAQTEKPKAEAQTHQAQTQEQKVEKRAQPVPVETKQQQLDVSKKNSKSPKRGKNEKYVYSIKRESTDESGSQNETTSKAEPREQTKPQAETHSETRKQQEQPQHTASSSQSNDNSSRYRKISPNQNVEYVQKEQPKTSTKQQDTSSLESREADKHQVQYQPKSSDAGYQKNQASKNISVQNASQTSYTPTQTTTSATQNNNYSSSNKNEIDEQPKNVKTLGQTSSNSNLPHQGNFGQINSFPPGNLQGMPTGTQNPQMQLPGMPMFFPQQQLPQTFLPPFNTFTGNSGQGQTEQKDIPSMFQMPYIVFPQPNGTAIIQPLYFSSPQMMPGQTMPGLVNPMQQTTSQTQFQKPNSSQQQFDVVNYFRQGDDNTGKSKGANQGSNDKSNENNSQKNASGNNLQESGTFFPFFMPNQQMPFQQNQGQYQFKSNNA